MFSTKWFAQIDCRIAGVVFGAATNDRGQCDNRVRELLVASIGYKARPSKARWALALRKLVCRTGITGYTQIPFKRGASAVAVRVQVTLPLLASSFAGLPPMVSWVSW